MALLTALTARCGVRWGRLRGGITSGGGGGGYAEERGGDN